MFTKLKYKLKLAFKMFVKYDKKGRKLLNASDIFFSNPTSKVNVGPPQFWLLSKPFHFLMVLHKQQSL